MEKKLAFDQKKADLLKLISEIGEEISCDEKYPARVEIGRAATALSEICSKHIEYYFSVNDVFNYFSAVKATIERLEKELQEEKEFNKIESEEKNFNQPTNC